MRARRARPIASARRAARRASRAWRCWSRRSRRWRSSSRRSTRSRSTWRCRSACSGARARGAGRAAACSAALAGGDAQRRHRAAAAGADALPVRPARGPRRRTSPRARARCAPRYRLRRDVLWLALCRRARAVHGSTSASRAATRWRRSTRRTSGARHFAGPTWASGTGCKAAFEGARQLLSLPAAPRLLPGAGGSPFVAAEHNLLLLAFLLAAVPVRSSACCAGCRSPTAPM